MSFLLLVSSIGLTFTVHYCGDSIASVSLATDLKATNEKDCCGIAIQKSTCCKNKHLKFEKKDPRALTKVFSLETTPYITFRDWSDNFSKKETAFVIKKQYLYACEANAPPLYKLYSQYIFYA